MKELTGKLKDKHSLTKEDITAAAKCLLDESAPVKQKVDFLSALSAKGETSEEIAGFASEFLDRAVDPQLNRKKIRKPLIDVCGTGGDKLDLFNISTTSVFVLAGAGAAVVKHGNRGITSKSGGADVLEALGIRIDLPPKDFSRCVEKVGAGFLFAQDYHPAFKAVAPVRKALAKKGEQSIFNLLGPLLNPARPTYQLIGVFDPKVGETFAEILKQLGRKRAWAVHGKTDTGEGMDEFSTLGETQVWSTKENESVPSFVTPDVFGFRNGGIEDLRGGDAKENAEILTGILDGSITGPKRDVVTLNAAAGLVICGLADNLREGIEIANLVLDEGRALQILTRWQEFS